MRKGLRKSFFLFKIIVPKMKKIILGLFIAGALLSVSKPAYSYTYSMSSEFLCEVGINLYQVGRYEEALHEFKKALMVQPDYEPALKYIQMIEEIFNPHPALETKEEAVNKSLKNIESKRALTPAPVARKAPVSAAASRRAPVLGFAAGELPPKNVEKVALPSILTLNESFKQLHQPIEIEKGSVIIISGRNIQRFLLTQPDILEVERKDSDEILVTGKSIGYSYLHVWDDGGRWTLEFLCILPRPKGPTLDEEMLLSEEQANSFKLRYALDWNSFEDGRRLNSMKRQYYAWGHSLGLTGATPYGNIDSSLLVRSLRTTTDLTYLTVGLTEGKVGNFQGFSLRGLDFSPSFNNIASSGMSALRGVMVESPTFDKKIDYTAFWGRESTGRYGALSPGLQKMRASYYDGINLNYLPEPGDRVGFSLLHGYGRDRLSTLSDYGYDAQADWHLGDWSNYYEMGFDGNAFANLFGSGIVKPRLRFNYELRDINKKYFSIGGEPWRRGERGGIFNFNLKPTDQFEISNRLDIYQDRLFPAPDNVNRFNEDYDFGAYYTPDPFTRFKFLYTLQNELGRVGQARYQMGGIGLSKTINFIRSIGTYIDYRHKERTNYTNPSSSYMDEDILAGLRFKLVGRLYYFFHQEWNWLEETYTGNRSQPRAFETGVDFDTRIGNSPFYENFRLIYRDEQDTGSPLSFFSGEDYLEGYTEITYRPVPEAEAYVSSRVRNSWADNPLINKHIEADLSAGMRYLWNTGLRWDSVGNIEGCVFRDLNSDGLRERDEAPVSGIKVLLGKNRSATTDIFGYYRFDNVKGSKAYVMLDVSSLPPGFVLTGPQRQEVVIQNKGLSNADFGIISRSEISGVVFCDLNDNDVFDANDQPMRGVQLILENGAQATTGTDGRYYFRNISTGKHIVTLILKSLSSRFLPKVPIVKEIEITEGIVYYHDIPLKKSED